MRIIIFLVLLLFLAGCSEQETSLVLHEVVCKGKADSTIGQWILKGLCLITPNVEKPTVVEDEKPKECTFSTDCDKKPDANTCDGNYKIRYDCIEGVCQRGPFNCPGGCKNGECVSR